MPDVSRDTHGHQRSLVYSLPIGLLILYAAFSLSTLVSFPFVHSDEAWLASLSRSMMEARSFRVTEEFFRLTPRHSHALKVLFHLLQMPFIAIRFSAGSVRLLSLAAGLAVLILHYRILKSFAGISARGDHDWRALLWTGALAMDVQFLYISHLARQEILMMLLLHAGIAWVLLSREWTPHKSALLGLLVGGSLLLHPNAALVAVALAGMVYSQDIPIRERFRHLFRYCVASVTAALIVGGTSFLIDPGFLDHYRSFGAAVGVTDSLLMKTVRGVRFFAKLLTRNAGTYYLPPVTVSLVLFAVVWIISVCLDCPGLRRRPAAAGHGAEVALRRVVLLLFLSTVALGKFSPPGVSLLWPPAYLLAVLTVRRLSSRIPVGRSGAGSSAGPVQTLLVAVILIASASTTILEIARPDPRRGETVRYTDRYVRYIRTVREALPPNSRVLANLNTAFAFAPDRLYVYRDLARLVETGLTIAEYISHEQIGYILYPDEMDLIYAQRPVWNDVYGNLYPYYDDLQEFLETECTVVAEIPAPVYAMRLVRYAGKSDYRVRVFRVDFRAETAPSAQETSR